MNEHGLSQFKLEQDDTKLELKKGGDFDVEAMQRMLASSATTAPAPIAQAAAAAPAASSALSAGGEASDALPPGVEEIPSPMVGTFFSAPDPASDSFVQVGSKVSSDTVVCIIEAMKVMNDITAELKGEIVEILVENGTSVQFGEPLYRVKTS